MQLWPRAGLREWGVEVIVRRSIGTVKWFHEGRGFGFITPDTGQQDCFVHHSALQGDGLEALIQGDRVEFDLVQAQKGPAAENVTRLARPAKVDR